MTATAAGDRTAGTDVHEPRIRREAARLRHERSLLGIAATVSPPLVLLSFTFIGAIVGIAPRALTGALEAGVPLAVGLSAASMLAFEPSLELQLASPGGFRPAALRRLGLLAAWAGALSLAATAAGRIAGLLDAWPGPANPLQDALMSLAPISLFAVWGCLVSIALRSRGAAATAVAGFWLAAIAFKSWFLTHDAAHALFPFLVTFAPRDGGILANRLVLLGLTAIGLAILAAWLGRGEWLLGSEDR